jgi:hypothetical protein
VVFEAFANNIEFGREIGISYATVNSRKIGSEGVFLYTVYIPRVSSNKYMKMNRMSIGPVFYWNVSFLQNARLASSAGVKGK